MKPLNSVMAALLAAISATCLSPRESFATTPAAIAGDSSAPGPLLPTPTAALADGAPQKEAPQSIAALIQKGGQAQTDVTARITDYVLNGAEKHKFAGDDVRADAQSKTQISAVVSAWVTQQSLQAASLYFALASGGPAPDWIKADATAAPLFRPGDRNLPACLATRLTTPPQSQVGKIQLSSLAPSVGAFLAAAGDAAGNVIVNCNLARKKRNEADIAANDLGAVPAPMSPDFNKKANAGPPDPLASNQVFGFNDLYVKGAQVGNVYRDAKDGYRTLSVKMYTVTQPNGTVINELGIVDITNPNNFYAPTYVKLPLSGKTPVTVYGGLNDGSFITRNYNLVVDMTTGQMTLTRPGGGQGMAFSSSGLAMARANQAAQQGTTTINGKQYYVLGEGGAGGSYQFFDKSKIDARGAGSDPLSLIPDFTSDPITIVDQSGNWVRKQTLPNLNAYFPNPNQQWHLAWQNNQWTVVSGPGDAPPSSTPATPATPATPPAPGTNPAAPVAPASNALTAPAGPSACAGQKCATFADAYTNRDVNADFNADWKGKLTIVRKTSDPTDFFLILSAGLAVNPGSTPELSPARGLAGLVGVRGFKDNIVLETKVGDKLTVQYQPIQGLLDVFNQKAQTNAVTGLYDTGSDNITNVGDIDVATDIISAYAPAVKDAKGAVVDKATAVATITKRAQARIAGLSAYTVGGTLTNPKKELTVNGPTQAQSWDVWPDDKVEEGGTGTPDPNLKGPGAVMDIVTTGSPDLSLPDSLDIGGGVTINRKDAKKDEHVGVYKAKGAADWYVMFQVNRQGGPARTSPIKLGGSIGAWMKNAGSVGMQGLQGVNPPLDINGPTMQFIGDDAKGAYVVYRYAIPAADGSNLQNQKGDCVGPVIWYGMGADDAQNVCVAGKL